MARGYHFPQKGIGRLRRASGRVEKGGALFKNWLAYSASIPTGSRFDHNPNLFFLLNPEDKKDRVLVAGGFYMPSSRQLRAVREAIAHDASEFERLFASKAFARRFPGGFSIEKQSSRIPKGFDPGHPKMHWIRLQAFFVWHPYKMSEFNSPEFPSMVAEDWKQVVRLNELLMKALEPKSRLAPARKPADLSERLGEVEPVRRQMDF